MSETTTEKYPLDFDLLTKGQELPTEKLQLCLGIRAADRDAYGLALLGLAKKIEQKLSDRGLDVVVRRRGDDLVILSDNEAAAHSDRRIRKSFSKASHFLRKQLAVDVTRLNDAEQKEHARRLAINGQTVAAMLSTRRRLLLKACTRKTPVPQFARPALAAPAAVVEQ